MNVDSMTVDTEVRQPLFARFFAQFSRLMERELGDVAGSWSTACQAVSSKSAPATA